MLESDYPHGDSSWPDTRAGFASSMRHLDAAAIDRISYEAAAALYRHPPSVGRLVGPTRLPLGEEDR